MSKKKKRRYKRNSKARRQNCSVMNRHHLCWTKQKWSHGALKQLRLHPYCIVSIPRDTLHHFIHARMSYIPVPEQRSAKYALMQLDILEKSGGISESDPIEKRLLILAALFDYSDQPTADAFRKQLRLVREFKSPP